MTSALPRRLAGSLAAVALLSTVAACGPTGPGAATGGADPNASVDAATTCPTEQPPVLAAGETRTVTMGTDLGTIVIKLESDLSPIAVANVAALVGCGYYDGVVFHRIVPGFVVQGGDPTGTGTGGPGYTIQDEPVTTTYKRGTVAMARSSQPNSVGSQFFIVLDDAAATSLADPVANNYQIIGTVTSGMDVADAIVEAAGGVELPDDPVAMTTVTIANP